MRGKGSAEGARLIDQVTEALAEAHYQRQRGEIGEMQHRIRIDLYRAINRRACRVYFPHERLAR